MIPPAASPPRTPRARSDRSRGSLLLDRYETGLLVGLVLALSAVLIAVHLPLQRLPGRVYWQPSGAQEALTLELVERSRRPERDAEAPVTWSGGADREPVEAPPVPDEPRSAGTAGEAPGRVRAPDRMGAMRVLDTAEIMPQVDGGLRNYYLHIEYPPAAARAGIEGRLTLEFVVAVDGSVSGIRVDQPLHPLCDSAAVRALRQTRFVPGRQNGQVVPVRMHLPVRFKLVDGPVRSANDRRIRPLEPR